MVDRTESESMEEAFRRYREEVERKHMGPSGDEFEKYKGAGQDREKPSHKDPVHEPDTSKSIGDAFKSRKERAAQYIDNILTGNTLKGIGLSTLGFTALEETGFTGTEIVNELAAQYPEAGAGVAAVALYAAADEFGLQDTIAGIYDNITSEPEYLEFEDHFDDLEEIEPEKEKPLRPEIETDQKVEIYEP